MPAESTAFMLQNSDDGYWIGFDLGGTKQLATIYDPEFKPVGKDRKKTKGYLGEELGMRRVIDTMKAAMESAGITATQLRGIGIGCPGPVHPEKGLLYEAPNLGWKKVPVKDILEKEFGCSVVVANDVDCGVYGEFRFGDYKKARCLMGVFPGTGIGAGCIYEGRIFRGHSISCMELGHIPMMPQGPLAGTGHEGSLEAIAGRLAIAGASAQAAYRGQAPTLMELSKTDLADIRSGSLAESIKKGDKQIQQIVEKAGRHIGVALAGVIHLMAPEIILCGGGLVTAMPETFMKSIQEGIDSWILPAYKDITKLKLAKLGDDAGVLGAAAWAKHVLTAVDID